ncbi:hypothetical protein H7F15_00100 [Pontibacter sp. Tf4]|uniref:hypothetical protein n=1 Tax=Pontibacter sp. Tf4 TaxID=2761620 RepID=UPI001626342B|nr:hypothetical protein [Pontibacter sp. Tf4]MBB6609426.1 hypothetical protein [Pontibacter sp. Tf4]
MNRLFLVLLCCLLSLTFECVAQEKVRQNIYYKLDSTDVKYTKYVSTHTSPYSKNKFTLNSFGLPCDCHIAGYLSFSGHTNSDVGDTSEQAKTISVNSYKKMKLISFNELVKLLREHDLDFNKLYNLYFVEVCKQRKDKYVVYNVKFRNSFVDSQ